MFVLVFTSIVIEALPFVLLGALVAALIQTYVPDRVFTRIGRLPLTLQMPGAVAAALAFPVCECGSIPVARRLIKRGLHPAAGLTFMLAAPVLNPVVLFSTYVAYSGRGVGLEMVAGRAGIGLAAALVVGVALRHMEADRLLRPRTSRHVHDHDHGHAHGHSRVRDAADHLTGDLLFMGKFVVAGAALAALFQTAIPQHVVAEVGRFPTVLSLAMMGLAFLLSLCSEADAFVAVSFLGFPLGAQLAFLTFGPVADVKLALLYSATFRRGVALKIIAVAAVWILAMTTLFQVLVG